MERVASFKQVVDVNRRTDCDRTAWIRERGARGDAKRVVHASDMIAGEELNLVSSAVPGVSPHEELTAHEIVA